MVQKRYDFTGMDRACGEDSPVWQGLVDAEEEADGRVGCLIACVREKGQLVVVTDPDDLPAGW